MVKVAAGVMKEADGGMNSASLPFVGGRMVGVGITVNDSQNRVWAFAEGVSRDAIDENE